MAINIPITIPGFERPIGEVPFDPMSLLPGGAREAFSSPRADPRAAAPRTVAPPLPSPDTYASDAGFDYDPVSGNVIDTAGGRIIPRPQDMAPGLPGSRDTMPAPSVFVDTSRGTAGAGWLAEHPERQPQAGKVNSPELYGAGGGDLTQADFEGRANMRRMLDAAYGPDSEPFDPMAAQIDTAKAEGDLRLAAQRAEDPVAFAQLQAELPERAKMSARLGAGRELGAMFKTFEDELGVLEQRRSALRKAPEYLAASKDVQAAAEAPFDREAERIRSHVRTMQQAMDLATSTGSRAPLYQQQF